MREECPYVCCCTPLCTPLPPCGRGVPTFVAAPLFTSLLPCGRASLCLSQLLYLYPSCCAGELPYVCCCTSIYVPPAVRESVPTFVAAPLFTSLPPCGRDVLVFVAAPLSTPLSRFAGKGRRFLINFITALPEGVRRSESISHFQRSEPFKIIFFSPPAYGGRRKEYVNRQHGIPCGDAVLSVPLAKKANFPTNDF